MQHSVLFLIAFFLHALSVQFLSIGTIVGVATGLEDPIQKTAFVVALQAIAAMGAVLLSRTRLVTQLSAIARLPVLFAMLVLSLALAQTEAMSATWLSMLTVRWLLGFVILAILNSDIRRLFAEEMLVRNRQAQILNTTASAVAFGLAPIIAVKAAIAPIFVMDLLWQVMAFAAMFWLTIRGFFGKPELNPAQPSLASLQKGRVWKTPALVAAVLVWAILGTFMIIEVPLLRERFDASAELISAFFLASILANLVATRLVRIDWLKHSSLMIMVIGGVGMVSGSVAYLHSYVLVYAFAAVVFLGLANGAFNLSQSTLLQGIEDSRERTFAFVLLRLYTNIGLLGGALIVYLADQVGSDYVMPISVVAFGVTLILFAMLRSEGGEVYVAQSR